MKFTLGYSPCPNDTFIFEALVNRRIDTQGITFEVVMEDVEKLNQMAIRGELDFTKLSIGAYAAAHQHYAILNAGSALGRGVGPLLVAREPLGNKPASQVKIAIPGKLTTANLLLSTFFPDYTNKVEMLFSSISTSVLMHQTDAGLLIHEGRFTYEKEGLIKIFDLGEVWEQSMHVPLPLGCIAGHRKLDEKIRTTVDQLIRSSLEFAFQNPLESKPYIKKHASEMDEAVIENHIALYVNEFSLDLGVEGQRAIAFLLKKGSDNQLLPQIKLPVFNKSLI